MNDPEFLIKHVRMLDQWLHYGLHANFKYVSFLAE